MARVKYGVTPPLFQGMIPAEDSPAGIKAVSALFALAELFG